MPLVVVVVEAVPLGTDALPVSSNCNVKEKGPEGSVTAKESSVKVSSVVSKGQVAIVGRKLPGIEPTLTHQR